MAGAKAGLRVRRPGGCQSTPISEENGKPSSPVTTILDDAAYWTVAEAASFHQVHPQSIRRWSKSGSLLCARTLGNPHRFAIPANPGQQTVG